MAILTASGLAAFRGERLVFRDLGLSVEAGGALLLLGANGSGKSTLLRLLAGLGRIEAGTIHWQDAPALGDDAIDPAAHIARVAYVGHLDAIKPGLTTAENLGLAARLSGGSIADALAALDLTPLADLPARMLSAGQRRRLALARLPLLRRPLWLLDEPTLGLDEASVARLATVLAAHRAGGGVVLAATHLPLAAPGRAEFAPRMNMLLALLARDLRLSVRHGADSMASLLFFVLCAALFPLAIGPAPETLGRLAPGIIWVCALLAALLPLDRLFGADFEDGSLDQVLTSGLPASGVALAKAASHWLSTGLPLLLAAVPLSAMLRMDLVALPALLAGLLAGTLTVSLLGTLCAAIVLGARRGGVLLPLLVLPLTTPILIFGVAAADAAAGGLTPRPHLLLLAAFLAGMLPLSPLAAGAALRAAAG